MGNITTNKNEKEEESLDMNTEISAVVQESRDLLDSFYRSEEQSLASHHKDINTQDDLRKEVSNFIGTQMETINRQSLLQDLITQKLIQKIALNELSTDELRGLLREISSSKSQHTTALLDLFKPTQQTNALMVAPTKDTESESISLSSEQRNSIDKLLKVVEVMNMDNKQEEDL